MIKDILLHVDGTQAGERRIAYAFDLADRHHARLSGLHVTAPVDVPPYYKPSMITRVETALEYRSVKDAKSAERLFKSAASQRSTPVLWQALQGAMAQHVCEVARWNDLIILGQYEREGTAERHPLSLAEDVASDSGRPVLVIPAAAESGRVRRALVGWDGSRQAVRALHDALPLLRQDKTVVEIAMIDAGKPETGALKPLLDHLKRHQIIVEGDVYLPQHGSTASVLVDRLGQGHFDLLIMGAYGHPAWLEFLFGGTTPSVLANASVPVLISH